MAATLVPSIARTSTVASPASAQSDRSFAEPLAEHVGDQDPAALAVGDAHADQRVIERAPKALLRFGEAAVLVRRL
jgi:hypothetical protein